MRKLTKKIICSQNPIEAYLNPDNVKKICKDGEDKIIFYSMLAHSLSLRGAPFVILEDGSNFYGFNKELLEKFFTQNK